MLKENQNGIKENIWKGTNNKSSKYRLKGNSIRTLKGTKLKKNIERNEISKRTSNLKNLAKQYKGYQTEEQTSSLKVH